MAATQAATLALALALALTVALGIASWLLPCDAMLCSHWNSTSGGWTDWDADTTNPSLFPLTNGSSGVFMA